jgi:hypothetical protein
MCDSNYSLFMEYYGMLSRKREKGENKAHLQALYAPDKQNSMQEFHSNHAGISHELVHFQHRKREKFPHSKVGLNMQKQSPIITNILTILPFLYHLPYLITQKLGYTSSGPALSPCDGGDGRGPKTNRGPIFNIYNTI